jgi:murein DD-endopeptidase MepM/ murein hydrolase activator NlpD
VLILLGLLIHFTNNSIARANFGNDRKFGPIASMADTLRSTTALLDGKIAGLMHMDSALDAHQAAYTESSEHHAIEQKLFDVKHALSYTIPDARPGIFELGQRVDRQKQFVTEFSWLLSTRRRIDQSLPTMLPASGVFSSPFGERVHPVSGARRMHTGVDIAAPTGTPILASSAGTVVFAGRKGGYGNCIEIDHGYGYHSLYGHASKLVSKVGDVVERGQEIALVGSTGVSTGSHVHFEVIVDSMKVDPIPFLVQGGTPAPDFAKPALQPSLLAAK